MGGTTPLGPHCTLAALIERDIQEEGGTTTRLCKFGDVFLCYLGRLGLEHTASTKPQPSKWNPKKDLNALQLVLPGFYILKVLSRITAPA